MMDYVVIFDGCAAYGPLAQAKAKEAVARAATSGNTYASILPLHSLSEELDDPFSAYWNGDAP